MKHARDCADHSAGTDGHQRLADLPRVVRVVTLEETNKEIALLKRRVGTPHRSYWKRGRVAHLNPLIAG